MDVFQHQADSSCRGNAFNHNNIYQNTKWQYRKIAWLVTTQLLFVCFITKSFLTFCHPHLLYQLYLGLYQATCVQSHQRQPMSAVAITAREVQVSAADYQTVPTVATGVSKPLCCRLTVTFTLTSENLSFFTTLLLLLVLIQLCIPCCWHLDSNYCCRRCRQSQLIVLSLLLLLLRLLGTFQLDFPRWHGQS